MQELRFVKATQEFHFCDIQVALAAGVRYARMKQRFDAIATAVETATGVLQNANSLNSSYDFEGWGPTLALDIQRQLTCNVGAYARLRHSVTFGELSQDLVEARVFPNPLVLDIEHAEHDIGQHITEIALGLYWGRCTSYGMLSVRAGYEAQYWHSAGGPNNTTDDLSLEGFIIGVGLGR